MSDDKIWRKRQKDSIDTTSILLNKLSHGHEKVFSRIFEVKYNKRYRQDDQQIFLNGTLKWNLLRLTYSVYFFLSSTSVWNCTQNKNALNGDFLIHPSRMLIGTIVTQLS